MPAIAVRGTSSPFDVLSPWGPADFPSEAGHRRLVGGPGRRRPEEGVAGPGGALGNRQSGELAGSGQGGDAAHCKPGMAPNKLSVDCAGYRI